MLVLVNSSGKGRYTIQADVIKTNAKTILVRMLGRDGQLRYVKRKIARDLPA